MKKLFSIIGLPLLFAVSQFFMTMIATMIFLMTSHHSDLEAWVGTEDYVHALAHFFSQYSIVIVIILFLIFFPVFYHKYHQEVKKTKKSISLFHGFLFIILGFSFGLLYNAILGSIHLIVSPENVLEGNTNLWATVISTVFLGPILEEYLFRGIVYHRLQKYYPIMKSLLLTGLIFAFSHTDIWGMIYAFLFHFILTFAYEKYDLKSSILVHMSANLASIIFTLFINQNMLLLELTLVIASFLLIGSYIGFKEK